MKPTAGETDDGGKKRTHKSDVDKRCQETFNKGRKEACVCVCVCVCVGGVVVGPLGQEDQGRPHWEGDLSGVAEL